MQVGSHRREQVDVGGVLRHRSAHSRLIQRAAVEHVASAVEVEHVQVAVTVRIEHATQPEDPVRQLPQGTLHVPQPGMGGVVLDVEVSPEPLSLRHGDGRHGRVHEGDTHQVDLRSTARVALPVRGDKVPTIATCPLAECSGGTVSSASRTTGSPVPRSGAAQQPDDIRHAHERFRAFVLGAGYPCVVGAATVRRGDYTGGLFPPLGTAAAVRECYDALRVFLTRYPADYEPTAVFVALFGGTPPRTERAFEEALWRQLQGMHDEDVAAWDPIASPNPDDPRFGFSIGGRAFFVIGLHPGGVPHRPSLRPTGARLQRARPGARVARVGQVPARPADRPPAGAGSPGQRQPCARRLRR